MNNISMYFSNPWLLFLIIPALALTLFPYFRLPKRYRKTRNRIVSMVLHTLVVFLGILVLSGLKFHANEVSIKNDVVIVVDKSESNRTNSRTIDDLVKSIVDESNDDYRIGIISFANGSINSSLLSSDKNKVYQDYLNNEQNNLDISATDIAEALYAAHGLFDNPDSGRIVLLSDGRETDGRAQAAANIIASSGTRIDVMYFPSKSNGTEAQITSVTVPDYVALGASVSISIVVESNVSKNAYLKIYDNGVLSGPDGGHQVTLSGGTDLFMFDHTINTARLHEIKVVLECDGDESANNNTYYTYVNIDGESKRILIVDGGTESQKLENLIKDDYAVSVATLAELSSNMKMIYDYDQLIFMNVAYSDLPTGFQETLENYVYDIGGGLLTIGGDKAYQYDDMEGTWYEDLMPVYSNTFPKALAVMLVIDASGSMTDGGSNRLDLAKQGAKNCVDELSKDDKSVVGVVAFNSSATLNYGPVHMSDLVSKNQLLSRIDGITSQTGTYYEKGITAAKNALNTFPGHENFHKHIIFLTDGQPNDEAAAKSVAGTLKNDGISMSTIALGVGHNGPIAEFVASLRVEVEGRGKTYNVTTEAELPSVMRQEAAVVSSSYINDEKFTPVIQDILPQFAGIISVPSLDGYYGTRQKEGITVVLTKESDAIYAEWTRGKGKVGSFMSDLNGKWSASYFIETSGTNFILGMINGLLPEQSVVSQDVNAQFSKQNYQTTIRITTSADTSYISAVATSPLGTEVTIDLTRQSYGIYGGLLKTNESGIYKITVRKSGASGEETESIVYTAFSYSEEYNQFYMEEEVNLSMKTLAEIGGGKMLYSTEGMFTAGAQTKTVVIDPQLAFLIAALALFLLDIVARKFKFKWPHELLKKKDSDGTQQKGN